MSYYPLKIKDAAGVLHTVGDPRLGVLIPSQAGNGGKVLTTDGSVTSWGVQSAASDLNYPLAILTSPKERTTVSATAATGTIEFDVITQGFLYYTVAAAGDWVLDLRGDAANTLDAKLAVGESISVTFMSLIGTTAYKMSSLTIDGVAQTIKWQDSIPPSSGIGSSLNLYAFTVIKTAAATYTVLGSMTKFA